MNFHIDKSLSKKLAHIAKSTENTIHRHNVSIQALKHTIITSKRNDLLALKAYITDCKELEQSFDIQLIELYLQLIERQLKGKPAL